MRIYTYVYIIAPGESEDARAVRYGFPSRAGFVCFFVVLYVFMCVLLGIYVGVMGFSLKTAFLKGFCRTVRDPTANATPPPRNFHR